LSQTGHRWTGACVDSYTAQTAYTILAVQSPSLLPIHFPPFHASANSIFTFTQAHTLTFLDLSQNALDKKAVECIVAALGEYVPNG
jgi:hypothetical protein